MRFKCWHAGKAVLALLCVAVLGWVVMSLWNWIVPGLFDGIHTLTYWRALGLLILSRLLFGGFRGRGPGGWRERREWRRWESMTPQEREKFKARRESFCRSRRGREPARDAQDAQDAQDARDV
jgi:hypothetical protein